MTALKRQKLDEALLALPVQKANGTPRRESIKLLQTILDYMRTEGLDKIADRPLFFADLYERRQLSLLLDAASVAQTETREHALLVIYACERSKYVGVDMFGVCLTGQSAAAALAYKPHPVPSTLDTLQDDDSRYLLESLAKGGRYAWTDLPAHDALQGIVVGLVRWLWRKQRATASGNERSQQHNNGSDDSQRSGVVGHLKEFEEQFTLIATSFDCANFFYAVLAERSRAKAFFDYDVAIMADLHCDYYAKHETTLDPTHMYAEIWTIIRKETFYAERVVCVAHDLYCSEPSRLALLRRHGLFPTMMSLCEHMHLRDKIFTYSNRRVKQFLSRLQHGTSFDAANVVDAVQHVFAMAAAIQKWCDYIDAAHGGIGEGAVRLCGALYAATPPRLPIAGKDPSFFFALEQLRASRALLTTAVLYPSTAASPPAHATVSRNGVTYGTHKFRLFVYFLLPTVASAASALPTDRPSATMTVLARFPSSQSYIDNVLCCLYETFGRLSANCGDTRYGRPFHNLAGMLEDFCREDCASLARRARQACIFAAKSVRDSDTLIDALEPRWCNDNGNRSQDAAAAAATATRAGAGAGGDIGGNFSHTRKPTNDLQLQPKKNKFNE